MKLTANQVLVLHASETFDEVKIRRNAGLLQASGPGRFVALIDNAQWGKDNGTGEPGGDAPLTAFGGVTLGPTDCFIVDALFADWNLDGQVDSEDVGLCDVGLSSGPHSSGWGLGDPTNSGATPAVIDTLTQIIAAGA